MGADIEGVMMGVPRGLALAMLGRAEEGRVLLEEAGAAAGATRAGPAAAGAAALLTEIDLRAGNGGAQRRDAARAELDRLGSQTRGGVAHALVLRARTLLGGEDAVADLRRAVSDLRAPGLLMGL